MKLENMNCDFPKMPDAISEFHAEAPRNDRTGYGVYLNYINRMNTFLGLGRFSFEVHPLEEYPRLSPEKEYRIYIPGQRDSRYRVMFSPVS